MWWWRRNKSVKVNKEISGNILILNAMKKITNVIEMFEMSGVSGRVAVFSLSRKIMFVLSHK